MPDLIFIWIGEALQYFIFGKQDRNRDFSRVNYMHTSKEIYQYKIGTKYLNLTCSICMRQFKLCSMCTV